MRLVDVLAAFRRRWVIILACILICAGVAGIYSKFTTKIYRAATTISVTPARFDYGNGLAAQQLLANYAVNITGQDLLRQLDQQLKLDISPDVLAHNITATSDNTALTISLTVDDTDPNRAGRHRQQPDTTLSDQTDAIQPVAPQPGRGRADRPQCRRSQ